MEKTKESSNSNGNRSYLVCEPCRHEDLSSPSSGFCLVCGEYLCQQCIREHRKNKASRYHRILKDDELPTSAKTCQFLKEFLLCKDHYDRELKFKCENHDVFVCDICIGTRHRKCEQITNMSTRGLTFDTEALAKSLLVHKEKLQKCKEAKYKSMPNLLKQSEYIKTEQQNVVTKIINHLEKQNEQCQEETEEIAQSYSDSIVSSVVKCKKAEITLSTFVEVFEISIKSEKPRIKHVVKNMIAKQRQQLKRMVRKEIVKGEMHLKLIPSTTFERINTIGIVKIHNADIENANEDADILQQQSKDKQDKCKKHLRSTQTIPDRAVTGNLFPWKNITSNVLKRHNVREKTDTELCTIVGIVVFSDGCLAFLDSTNKKIKMFNRRMEMVNFRLLSDEPLGITKCLKNKIALLHDHGSQISVFDYLTDCKNIEKSKQFCLPNRCSSVSHNTKHLVLLEKKTPLESTEFETRVHICDMSKANIIETISYKGALLKNPTCILSKNEYIYIVGDNKQVVCFNQFGEERWRYRQYKLSTEVKDVVSLTVDKNGNTIACCQGSENIHAISAESFWENSVILTGLCGVKVAHYDVITKNLVIGYHSDRIHIASFKKKETSIGKSMIRSKITTYRSQYNFHR